MDGEVLRDDQWEKVKSFVPDGRKGKRGPRSDGRRFFDALLWMARSGARWRDLPEDRLAAIRPPRGVIIAGSRLACLIVCSKRWPPIPTSNGFPSTQLSSVLRLRPPGRDVKGGR